MDQQLSFTICEWHHLINYSWEKLHDFVDAVLPALMQDVDQTWVANYFFITLLGCLSHCLEPIWDWASFPGLHSAFRHLLCVAREQSCHSITAYIFLWELKGDTSPCCLVICQYLYYTPATIDDSCNKFAGDTYLGSYVYIRAITHQFYLC